MDNAVIHKSRMIKEKIEENLIICCIAFHITQKQTQ